MSDTIKLSELLEAGAAALAEEVGYFIENGHDDLAANVASKSKALRAIAPALVELVKAQHALIIGIGSDSTDGATLSALYDRCSETLDAFTKVMKEAGVTCE